MTWSIIARDPATGAIGIAVATKFFAVGALVPHIQASVGAVATQALVNPHYGARGLKLLRDGTPPFDVVRELAAADDGRAHRQVHVMNAAGQSAAYTGAECIDWCGARAQENLSIAGNMLVSPRVLEDTEATYRANAALPFPRRLIAAMLAGEAAGGDKRGKQSAALLIYGEEEWPDLDLRVDDHPDPLAELARLEQVSRERWTHFRKFPPSRRSPAGIVDRDRLETEIAKSIATEGKG
jgi:uncharacterized Ntn-hydrolase superfamily protein